MHVQSYHQLIKLANFKMIVCLKIQRLSVKIFEYKLNYYPMDSIYVITARYTLRGTTPHSYASITSENIYALLELAKTSRNGSRAMSWGQWLIRSLLGGICLWLSRRRWRQVGNHTLGHKETVYGRCSAVKGIQVVEKLM